MKSAFVDILEYSETAQMTRRLDKEDSMSVKLTGMNMKSTNISDIFCNKPWLIFNKYSSYW
ncbi:hypothetical protein ACI3PF_17080, partial [Lactococcus lactis]